MSHLTHTPTANQSHKAIAIGRLAELTALKSDAPVISEMLDDVLRHFKSLELSAIQKWQLLSYLNMLLLWNKAYNLTAIHEPKTAFIKHIVDCLAMVAHLPSDDHQVNDKDTQPIRLLDVGTGAGLPAMVIAICRPDVQCVALDSNQKKIRFIKQAISELGIENCLAIAQRIETHTGNYDWITSRAFANLQTFVDLVTPYLAKSGYLLAMKARLPNLSSLDLEGYGQLYFDKNSYHHSIKADNRMLSESAEQYEQLTNDWRIKIIGIVKNKYIS